MEADMTFRFSTAWMTAGLTMLIAAGTAHAADGDPEQGKKLFFGKAQCKICHKVEKDKKFVGPSVFGIVGRKCGASAKQRYSSNYKAACEKTGFVWDAKSLDGYLADPSGYISGIAGQKKRSPMTVKVKNAQDRADIIAYLATLK
jgi:cytochrome c